MLIDEPHDGGRGELHGDGRNVKPRRGGDRRDAIVVGGPEVPFVNGLRAAPHEDLPGEIVGCHVRHDVRVDRAHKRSILRRNSCRAQHQAKQSKKNLRIHRVMGNG